MPEEAAAGGKGGKGADRGQHVRQEVGVRRGGYNNGGDGQAGVKKSKRAIRRAGIQSEEAVGCAKRGGQAGGRERPKC